MKFKYCLTLLAVAAIGLPQSFQMSPKVTEAQKAADQGLYLKGWRLLKEALAEAKTDDEKNMVRGSLSQYAPYVGEIMAARQYEADSRPKQEEKPISATHKIQEMERLDALTGIVKESKGRQIVILNEEHNSTQCRAFNLEVARALGKEGFKTMGIETLSPQLPDSVKADYPLRSIGYYTKDAFFNDFVRQSMRMGYKLVEYETQDFSNKGDMFDRINFRETDQANHLIERVLKKDPKARLVLFVGYSHATENWEKVDEKRELGWLAARLKRMTGIDPLTIDQTAMSERASGAYESMTYRFVDSKGWLKKPTTFRSKDGKWFTGSSYADNVDMQVFHPRSIMQKGRAHWMRMGGYRHDITMKPAWLPKSGELLIQAFVASEGKDAVPMDQVIVRANEPAPVLLLPKGKYRIESQDDQGNIKTLGSLGVGRLIDAPRG
jgi:hypothetical protein